MKLAYEQSGGEVVKSCGSGENEEVLADAEIKVVPERRRSLRIQKMTADGGMCKMDEDDKEKDKEEEVRVEKCGNKKPESKRRKVVPERRRSVRIQKMTADGGKCKMKEKANEEEEVRVEKCGNKKPESKRRKVEDVGGYVEVVGLGGTCEHLIAENVIDGVDSRHWVMIDGVTHVKEDDRSEQCKKADSSRVKETLKLYEKHYMLCVQEEEKRCKKKKPDRKLSKAAKQREKYGKIQKADSDSEDSTGSIVEVDNFNTVERNRMSKRPDIKVIQKMKEKNSILFPLKKIGSIPGVNVGDRFFSRAQMCVIGFHRPTLSGIDYMGQKYSEVKEYKNYKFPLAISVVISGLYEDDKDNLEDVTYTGQGGNNLLGDKHQVKDQELKSGNLALKNCIEQSVPIRVIRGHVSHEGSVGKVYTYDGLYEVVKYWRHKGISSFYVYKFRLRRLGGQPPLTTKQVRFAFGGAQKLLSNVSSLICQDISEGEEKIPIRAVNEVDSSPFATTVFTYHKSMRISETVQMPACTSGCNCKGACTDSSVCACAGRNGSDFPYVICARGNGKCPRYRLIEAKDVIFECGPSCDCGPDCVNRASQRGIEYRLEVFKTLKKGWAVRSLEYIPSGAVVCEYIGVLKRTDELDSAQNNDYIFDIDCVQTMEGLEGREKRYRSAPNNILDMNGHKSEAPEYCVDAGSSGNVARFISHSCEPNLFVQCVLSSHSDPRLARIVLVASDNISPLQELTYDYNYALDSVADAGGKPKQLECHCGAAVCRKRLY